MDGMEIFMAIIEKGGYGSIKDSGGRASGNWKGMSGIKGSGGMKGMEENRKPHRHIRSFQVIILGFALLILAGSLILMLPWATRDGRGASFADALFTATSAACVTGLVVQDTATYWSGFGQAVILLLIQIGGMGVVTVAVFITSLSGRKIGLMQRSTMQDSISAPQMGGIVRMTGFILRATLVMELTGAVFLAFVFCGEMGVGKGLWYALFHSVSAFCNAGFDLMGFREKFSSLTAYQGQPVVNLVIMALIITGGIGFFVWKDIQEKGLQFKKYRLQTKVVLVTSAALILVPAVFYFFMEYADLPVKERFLSSFFQAVTPRTAGFNTTDLSKMGEGGQVLMVFLMLIGGSPGSTAGGLKTTTLAVLYGSALSVFVHEEHVHFFGRRITDETIKNAATILLMYLTLFLTGGIAISTIEGISMKTALFETASAVGTVGLSLGATPTLGGVSRAILIGLMFLGRVGGLTLIFAAVSEKRRDAARFPEEKITVG